MSEWEGGRQAEASKVIFAEEQTVVPEQELRIVHLSGVAGPSTQNCLIRLLFGTAQVRTLCFG